MDIKQTLEHDFIKKNVKSEIFNHRRKSKDFSDFEKFSSDPVKK